MKQLIAAHEAVEVPDQPLRPCSDCPWTRTALNGWLGSLTPHEWLSAAHSDALVDCHALRRPGGGYWQCAGIAVYRANVYKRSRDPEVLRGERDHVHVFSSPAEFLRHHERTPCPVRKAPVRVVGRPLSVPPPLKTGKPKSKRPSKRSSARGRDRREERESGE